MWVKFLKPLWGWWFGEDKKEGNVGIEAHGKETIPEKDVDVRLEEVDNVRNRHVG